MWYENVREKRVLWLKDQIRVQDMGDMPQQAVNIERFDERDQGAFLDALQDELIIRISGHQDKGQAWLYSLDGDQQFDTIHAFHLDVRKHAAVALIADHLERIWS